MLLLTIITVNYYAIVMLVILILYVISLPSF